MFNPAQAFREFLWAMQRSDGLLLWLIIGSVALAAYLLFNRR